MFRLSESSVLLLVVFHHLSCGPQYFFQLLDDPEDVDSLLAILFPNFVHEVNETRYGVPVVPIPRIDVRPRPV